MVIARPKAIAGAPHGAAAQRRTAAGGLSCLARNGRIRGPRAACRVGWFPRGRKFQRRGCAIGGRGVSRPWARSTHRRGRMGRSKGQKRSWRCWRPVATGGGSGKVRRSLPPCPDRTVGTVSPCFDRRAFLRAAGSSAVSGLGGGRGDSGENGPLVGPCATRRYRPAARHAGDRR